jgi:hypothetical protein
MITWCWPCFSTSPAISKEVCDNRQVLVTVPFVGNSQAGAATDQLRCRLPDTLFSRSVASLATKNRRFTCSQSPLAASLRHRDPAE